jgi:hypothetical protein
MWKFVYAYAESWGGYANCALALDKCSLSYKGRGDTSSIAWWSIS